MKIIRKADIYLFLALMLAAVLLFIIPVLSRKQSAGQVVIRCDGEIYGTYDIQEDQKITIQNGYNENIVMIQDGKVWMESASCKNQICVQEGMIERPGQTIVCLPNRVTVEITGVGDEQDVDVIAQ